MPIIAAGASQTITLEQGLSIVGNGVGTAVIGPGPRAGQQIGLVGIGWRVGPFPGVQVVYVTATGEIGYETDEAGAAELVGGDELVVAAAELGLRSGEVDSTAAFTAIASQILNAAAFGGPTTEKVVIKIPPGVYTVDGAKMDLTFRGAGAWTPIFTLKGSGVGATIIRSSPTSTAAAVLEIGAGYAAHVILEDIEIQTRQDIVQDGLHVFSTRRTIDNTGGATDWTLRRVGIRSYLGDAAVWVAGDDFFGPHQFLLQEMCRFQADIGTALRTFGQYGQLNLVGGEYSGGLAPGASTCPAMAFSKDMRQTHAPTAVNTSLNFVTVANLEAPTGTPVRIVGTNLPSGLSTGTTYFLRRYDMAGTGNSDRFSLHSTRANVSANTRVALGSAGTLGNWYITPLYVTSVADNELRFELPHHLPDGNVITIVGTGLPSGLSTATNYYVIRRNARAISLATSKANALAGVAITISGGTPTLFGLSALGTGSSGPYSLNMANVTTQNSMSALYLSGCGGVQATLHLENCRNSIHVHQSQVTIMGGEYSNGADDGGAGVLLYIAGSNSRVTVEGAPVLTGVTEKEISNAFGAFYTDSVGGFVNTNPSTTTQRSSGVVINLSVSSATLDVGPYDFVTVNASATQITSIASSLPTKAEVQIVAIGGSITFAQGGTISLPSGTVVIGTNVCATFKRVDTLGTWQLVSKSA